MRIESARALKQEILESLAFLDASARTNPVAQTRRLDNRPRPPGAPFAFGISGQKRDAKLAVRVLRRLDAREREFLKSIEDKSKREIDIRYIGPIWSRARGAEIPWYRDRVRPLRIGLSVAHKDVPAGTLGGFVRCNRLGKPMILSNNHIIANEGRAQSGDAVFQPGPHDGGRDEDRVGHFSRCCGLLRGAMPNHVDAGIALIDSEIEFDPNDLGSMGKLTATIDDEVLPGEQVHKIGRTSGLTTGIVSAIEVDLQVRMEIGLLTFVGQIEVSTDPGFTFSDPGDSGSMVFDDRNGPVGLVFAGTDPTETVSTTFVNPISIILDKLDVSLIV